jgi:crotonobetainyl-CoA:carnitine CoA-transferase CaiB-like acyl-CoA transferase
MAYLISGRDFPRNGNRAPQTAPSDVYMASDGPIFITCGNNTLFRRLAGALSRPELADDPRFADNATRVGNFAQLTKVLNGLLATDTRAHWMTRLMAAGVPAAPVASIGEAAASDDARRRRLVSEIPHPKAGFIPNVRSPFLFGLTPVADPVAPPLLGQHTQEVMRETLGYDGTRIAALAAAGAFGPPGVVQTS